MTSPRKEKAYEKHAWLFLFALGAFFLILGSVWLSMGLRALTPSGTLSELGPLNATVKNFGTLADYIKLITSVLGLVELSFSFFIMATALKSYRKGEKWAWYVFWSPPALAVTSTFLFGLSFETTIILVLSLLGLLLPYRKFFPKKQV